jgi:hypothetical protein
MSKESEKPKLKSIKFAGYVPNITMLYVSPVNQNSNKVFELSISDSYNLEVGEFNMMLVFKIFSDEDKKNMLAEIHLQHSFKIGNLNDFLQESNGSFTFDRNFLSQLLGISISTSRGIIMVKLEGILNIQTVVPIMYPMDLIL